MALVKRYRHAAREQSTAHRARSDHPSPGVHRDQMDAIRNHADGQMYDSKSAYHKAVKDAGCEVIGNDVHPDDIGIRRPEPDMGNPGQDIKDAMDQVEAKTNTGEISPVD